MRRVVTTKEELKKAVADDVDEIVVSESLVKDIKPVLTAMKLPAKKLAALIAFLSASAVGIISSLALTPATAGTSALVGLVAGVPSVAVFAATSGTSVVVVVLLILLCAVVGVDCIVKLLRLYDVAEEETTYDLGGSESGKKDKGFTVVITKKTKYWKHEK